ncbi:MAG: glycosyltransferase family 2 protein [Candidatus Babeliales bacterium]
MNKQVVLVCLAYLLFQLATMQCSELPIVVLICSYNNQEWVVKNLDSVFMQNYQNYRVIYIDDCSQDNTALIVQSYRDTYDLNDQIKLIQNTTRCRKMKNIYTSIHNFCEDHEIVVQLDGDDWFIDDQLFAHLNELYQKDAIWLTYGSDTLHYAQPTPKKTIHDQVFRKQKWIYAPTRSFYAWLFKAINVQDLLAENVPGYQGLFFPSADDVAFMYPMLEMAGNRHTFIKHINYHVNTHNPLSNRKIEFNLQEAASLDIRMRPPYPRFAKLKESSEIRHKKAIADICIISDHAKNLETLLISIKTYVTHHGMIAILYTKQITEHQALIHKYPDYHFIASDTQPITDSLKDFAQHALQPHILLMCTDIKVTAPLDLRDYSIVLEKTGAHGFYFGISCNQAIDTLQHLFNDVYAWKLAWSENSISSNSDMTLLRTKDILNNKKNTMHEIGLCLAHAITARCDSATLPELRLHYQALKRPLKKRRLHVPGVDPRTKTKNKSKKALQKENVP